MLGITSKDIKRHITLDVKIRPSSKITQFHWDAECQFGI